MGAIARLTFARRTSCKVTQCDANLDVPFEVTHKVVDIVEEVHGKSLLYFVAFKVAAIHGTKKIWEGECTVCFGFVIQDPSQVTFAGSQEFSSQLLTLIPEQVARLSVLVPEILS